MEYKIVKGKCQLFNQFLIDRVGMPAQLFEETNKLLETAYQEKNIKALKAADSDMNEQIRHISLPLALEFKNFLKRNWILISMYLIKKTKPLLSRGFNCSSLEKNRTSILGLGNQCSIR